MPQPTPRPKSLNAQPPRHAHSATAKNQNAQKSRLFRYEYREWLAYLAVFALIFAADRALPLAPLGLGVLFALSGAGFSPFALAALCLISAATAWNFPYFCGYFCAAVTMAVIFTVYRAKKVTMGAESVIYLAVSLLCYVLFGGAAFTRAALAALTMLFCYAALAFFYPAVKRKGIFRPTPMQTVAGGVVLLVVGTGVYRALGAEALLGVAALALLLCAYFGRGTGALAAAVLSLPAAFIEGTLALPGLFFTFAATTSALMPAGRFFAAISLPTVYAAFSLWLPLIPFSLPVGASICAAAFLFLLLPSSLLKRGAEALSSRREKRLTRAAINRDRALLSAKTMHLAAVFREIEGLFSTPAVKEDEAKAAAALTEEIMQDVCARCKNRDTCVENRAMNPDDLLKAVAIGMAKGRISMLDLPGSLLRACVFPNNLLFCANGLLSRYRETAFDRENAALSRKLVGAQAGGVAEVLENLSFTACTPCLFDRKKEGKLFAALAEKGVFPEEIMVEEGGAVSLILAPGEVERLAFIAAKLSKEVGVPLSAEEMLDAERGRKMVTFRPAPRLDVAFGIATAKKAESTRSGDTYSALRLGSDGFLVAISDGMGSGEAAETVSSSAMTLIESFYRAGFCSATILSSVNKLLSARAEENFAALDIAAISLSSGRCDFIKIGAPYGFTMKKEGIAIVPGSSLPLGILEDLRPEVCSDTLFPGDVLVLASDGVTDAFGSSSDFLDFLSACKERNPQTLADSVLRQAVRRSGGSAADDMTVLCLRLFEKAG